jgi:hypothetical protein
MTIANCAQTYQSEGASGGGIASIYADEHSFWLFPHGKNNTRLKVRDVNTLKEPFISSAFKLGRKDSVAEF